jgi:hypothetical protein
MEKIKEDFITISADNFEKVIIFKTCQTIKKIYKTLDSYIAVTKLLTKHVKTPDDLKLINQFNSLFQIDKNTVKKLITVPKINGKYTRITTEVLNLIKERGIIKRFNHRNINYKSGKPFTMCNVYIIDVKHIQNYYYNNNVFNTNSDFYSKKQHKLIDKFILNYNKSEDTIVKNNFKKENNMKAKQPKQKTVKQKVVHPENDIIDIDTTIDTTKKIKLVEQCCKENVLSKKMGEHILKTFYGINHTIKYSPINEDLMKTENSKMRLKILTNLLKKYRSQIDEDEYKYFEKLCKDLCKIHGFNFDDLIKAIIK